ncbi:MAG TPA: Crp/Fnr family transcriptional regulator [Xanthomonadaceae bacterium]|nr:Crp/Fnr family transcriptional regulator [Xanthomonadaceae bacterium]
MLRPSESPVANGLIAGLPFRVRDRLLRQDDPVELVAGDVLSEQGQPYSDAYFPLTGRISQMVLVAGHPPLSVVLIGSEGMLGATLLLGSDVAPLRAVVQGSGRAWRVSAVRLRRALRDSSALRATLGRYLLVRMEQWAQATACARFHEVGVRLARCLLLVHDRAHSDRFHMTHQALADMLGVQRSAVTLAAGALQAGGVIRYSRGGIDILSRDALEAASCGCYAADVDAFARGFSNGGARSGNY